MLAGSVALGSYASSGLAFSTPPRSHFKAVAARTPSLSEYIGRHGKHCALVHSDEQWAEGAPSPITGHWYAVGAYRMPCKGSAKVAGAANLVVLALAVAPEHNSAHDGFHCTVTAPLNSGYCYTGSLKKAEHAVATGKTPTNKIVMFAPESECADPDPPYTTYETLPVMCHE
jgi:hypothetical protein